MPSWVAWWNFVPPRSCVIPLLGVSCPLSGLSDQRSKYLRACVLVTLILLNNGHTVQELWGWRLKYDKEMLWSASSEWKGESSQLIRKEKRSYTEMAKIYDKNRSSIHEIVKKEKRICASFAVGPPAAEVTATVWRNAWLRWKKHSISMIRLFFCFTMR